VARLNRAAVGVSDHAGHAILVTVGPDATLLDRRRIELVEPGLPTFPIHHQGQWAIGRYTDVPWAYPVTMAEAQDLITRVRESAARCAPAALNDLAAAISLPIESISIRACPPLPATIEEQIADARAQTVADGVMYRQALAAAAAARGWNVLWYDAKHVREDAAAALGHDIDATLRAMGKAMGPPWQADHKLAAAAALAARLRGSA
jgi:hypothetical protein